MVRAGPFEVPTGGTLLRTDRDQIFEETRCSAAIRKRDSWPARMLTVCGPAKSIDKATRMAWRAIEANGQGDDVTPENNPWAPFFNKNKRQSTPSGSSASASTSPAHNAPSRSSAAAASTESMQHMQQMMQHMLKMQQELIDGFAPALAVPPTSTRSDDEGEASDSDDDDESEWGEKVEEAASTAWVKHDDEESDAWAQMLDAWAAPSASTEPPAARRWGIVHAKAPPPPPWTKAEPEEKAKPEEPVLEEPVVQPVFSMKTVGIFVVGLDHIKIHRHALWSDVLVSFHHEFHRKYHWIRDEVHVVIDCRMFHERQLRGPPGHTGLHYDAEKGVLDSRQFGKWLAEAKRAVAAVKEVDHVNIAMVCSRGTNRSVSCGSLFAEALQAIPSLVVGQPEFLSKGDWARKHLCVMGCPKCRPSGQKAVLYATVRDIFVRV